MISVDKPGMPARLPESLLDGVVAQLAPMSRR
jgi:hypothetical protein